MIRWSYLLPRMAILATLLLVIVLCFDGLLRWGLIRSGQLATGTKVDIDSLRTSFHRGTLHLRGIQIANPQAPDRNWVEVRDAYVEADMRALLLGRLDIVEGTLQGLKFDGERTTPGALPRQIRRPAGANARSLEQWLEDLRHLLNDPIVDSFESVALARELATAWPAYYQDTERQVQQTVQRVRSLRDTYEQVRHKPLENVEALRQLISDSSRLRNDLTSLRETADRLLSRAKEDQQRVEFARRRDLERITDALRLSRLDNESISDRLLGPEFSPYVAEAVEWARWGKRWLDAAGDPPRAQREHGVTLAFPRRPPAPDWLVRRLRVSGEIRFSGRPTPFEGVLTGLTSEQDVTKAPARLSVRLDGVRPGRLEAVADCRGGRPHHTIVIDCPAIALGRHTVGNSEDLKLTVDQGRAHWWTRLDLEEQNLEGLVVWKQDDIRLTASLSDRLGGPRAARFVSTALQNATHLHALLHISGTIEAPQWKIEGGLGSELAEGLQRAATTELESRRQALTARLHLEVAREFTRLQSQWQAGEQRLMEQLQTGDALLTELQQLLAAAGVLDPLKRRLEEPLKKIEDPLRRLEEPLRKKIEAAGLPTSTRTIFPR